MQQAIVPFMPVEIATRLVVSIGVGLLIGLERQWSHKEIGSRTFTLAALLGTLSALISGGFAIVSLAGVTALIVVVCIGNIRLERQVEATTSAALLVTCSLGVLIGQGHIFTPAAAAILVTLLLSLKPQLSRFAGGLSHEEVRGAVLLGLIGFVIYPVLPDRFIDPWKIFNPRENWLTVILIAAIGFVNYVLLKLYSVRGLFYTAFFGGLVNSTAAIAELSGILGNAESEGAELSIFIDLLTVIAMLIRNLALLSIFSHQAGLVALGPIGAMVVAATGYAWWRKPGKTSSQGLKIGSPVEVGKIVSFGALFLVIQVAGTLGQRLFGPGGTVAVSILGGFVSSASSTAAAAALSEHRSISPHTAALCTILTSIASTMVNLPVIYRQTRDKGLIRRLVLISVAISAIGLLVLAAEIRFLPVS